MVEVVVVSAREFFMTCFLSANEIDVKKGDKVIFKNGNGTFCGTVIKDKYLEKEDNLELPLLNIDRIANEKDIKVIEKNNGLADKSLNDAKKFSKELELDMNFIDAYFNYDQSQLLFTFLSDNRVDFRDLAKKLAQKYKTRIELIQVGVRDKSKRVGGLGPCGLFLCCNSFLTDFNSVSINMAKNQMLALNPTKINGICGRLLCCLAYENDTYSELKKDLPKLGSVIETPVGSGKVSSVNVLKNTYSVDLKEKGIVEFNGENNESTK